MILDISEEHRAEVLEFLVAVADDEFFAGQRLGMWLSASPTLEADNALTSIAQDELGHARLFYDIVAEEKSTTTDELAISRGTADRRNSILVEREHEDFADTITRHYLYDEAEQLLLESMHKGDEGPLADVAEVVLNEEPFHLEHARKWFDILDATEESAARLNRAFRKNVKAASDLFSFENAIQESLIDSGVLAHPPEDLAAKFETTVKHRVADLAIEISGGEVFEALSKPPTFDGRAGEHTADLDHLIDKMQPKPIERI